MEQVERSFTVTMEFNDPYRKLMWRVVKAENADKAIEIAKSRTGPKRFREEGKWEATENVQK
jgi:hypothetical protein